MQDGSETKTREGEITKNRQVIQALTDRHCDNTTMRWMLMSGKVVVKQAGKLYGTLFPLL
jgi:hypothetical protein